MKPSLELWPSFFSFFLGKNLIESETSRKSSLNINAMQKFIIKTHRPGTKYPKPHFYILNKGLNCGKPLNESCPNCFVIQFNEESDLEEYYWLAYSLWQSKYWHQFLIGSVIPFFRIDAFSKEFTRKSERMLFEFAKHQNQVKALRLLQAQENKYTNNLKLIKEMRNVILQWYWK